MLDFTFFAEPERAQRLLADLDGSAASARFSVRTRKLARKVEPLLLDWLRRIADPDAALTAFVRFVERYGARGLLFETLLRNPKLMELLVRLFDGSRFMSKIESRPSKRKAWEYFFFVDVDGHSTEPKLQEALAELEKHCTFIKVLGTYPKTPAT